MDNNNGQQIAATTRSQIRPMDLMAVGAQRGTYTFDKEGTLKFKVGGRMKWIEIALENDTYTVRLVRIKAKTFERVIVDSVSGIYNDMLSSAINNVYHGRTSGY